MLQRYYAGTHTCYSINLLVSASGWHPRVTATVSLLTYDFPYLYLCNHG